MKQFGIIALGGLMIILSGILGGQMFRRYLGRERDLTGGRRLRVSDLRSVVAFLKSYLSFGLGAVLFFGGYAVILFGLERI